MKITRSLQKGHFLYIDFAHSHALWSLGTFGSVYPFHRFQQGSTGLFNDIYILYRYIYNSIYRAHYRAHSIVHSIVHSTCSQLIIYDINNCNKAIQYNPTLRHIRIAYVNSLILRHWYYIRYCILGLFKNSIDYISHILYNIYIGGKK